MLVNEQKAIEFIKQTKEVELYRQLFDVNKRLQMEESMVEEMSNKLQTCLRTRDLRTLENANFFGSGKAEHLIPDIIIGAVLEGAEPEVKIADLFNKIQYNKGSVIQFPVLGEIRAFPVAEGQEFRHEEFDINQYRTITIKLEKYGVAFNISEECIDDSQWDILGYWLRAAGRAMARLKEEQCAIAMTDASNVVFDALSTDPQFQPTGVDSLGSVNGTMSIMDFVDMMAAVMLNNHQITDIMIHPLAWLTFLKNELIGSYSQSLMNHGQIWGANSKTLNYQNPGDIIARNLPVPVNVIITPYAPLDRVNRRFDMIAFDRNNLGVIIQRQPLTTGDWEDPKRDVYSVKVKERYGIAIADQGRGIVTCKNLSLAPTFNAPMLVNNVGN